MTYRIQTMSDFVPKQMRPYRVPVVFQAEVKRQISELLDMGFIRPSVSPMASPIFCVAKKSGGVRITCDYRCLNSFTVGHAYPMSTINEVQIIALLTIYLVLSDSDLYICIVSCNYVCIGYICVCLYSL